MSADVHDMITAAERRWLTGWAAGPTRLRWTSLPAQLGDTAPDHTLPDHEGRPVRLSSLWRDRPLLLLFWRHFGCSCGSDRAGRLRDELPAYRDAGADIVIIGQGEPERAAASAISSALTSPSCQTRSARPTKPAPRDGVGVATDLHTLLAHVPGPFVLVGHSSGAQYVRIFSERYPSEVAGAVLLDPQPAEAFTRLPVFPTFYRVFRRVSALFPALARIGVARLMFLADSGSLPPQARKLQRAYSSSARSSRSLRDEFAQLPLALAQANAVRSLGDVPLVVVTAVRDAQDGWLPLQGEMASLSSNSLHLVLANATHSSLIEEKHDAETSSLAIRQVIESVRSGRALGATNAAAVGRSERRSLTSAPAAIDAPGRPAAAGATTSIQ